MDRFYKPISFLFFFFLNLFVFAQDSVYHWTVRSKKNGEGKFELIFSTPGASGWQLYSPNQTIPDFAAAELKFGDSAITQQNGFAETGEAKQINSIPLE